MVIKISLEELKNYFDEDEASKENLTQWDKVINRMERRRKQYEIQDSSKDYDNVFYLFTLCYSGEEREELNGEWNKYLGVLKKLEDIKRMYNRNVKLESRNRWWTIGEFTIVRQLPANNYDIEPQMINIKVDDNDALVRTVFLRVLLFV